MNGAKRSDLFFLVKFLKRRNEIDLDHGGNVRYFFGKRESMIVLADDDRGYVINKRDAE